MKLKALALCCTMALMTTFSGAFALDLDLDDDFNFLSRHRDHHVRERLERVKLRILQERAQDDLSGLFAAIGNIYSYEGAVADPNPTTNSAVAGTIAANRAVIDFIGDRFFSRLDRRGVPNAVVTSIRAQLNAFVDASLAYSLAMNLNNVGQIGGDQEALAVALQLTALNLGTTFAALANDPTLVGEWTTIATLLTEGAQAYRLVLADSNTFGAEPAVPSTETVAAVRIFATIQAIIRVKPIFN